MGRYGTHARNKLSAKTGKFRSRKREKSWRIPDEAEKPVDGRILSGKYVKKRKKKQKTFR